MTAPEENADGGVWWSYWPSSGCIEFDVEPEYAHKVFTLDLRSAVESGDGFVVECVIAELKRAGYEITKRPTVKDLYELMTQVDQPEPRPQYEFGMNGRWRYE